MCIRDNYDTLQGVIGITGDGNGSLKEFGITYRQVDLTPENTPDLPGIAQAVQDPAVKAVLIQRSRGYATRASLSVARIEMCIRDRHAASLCAITNPSTNSYKRLVPGFEAPVTIGYAMANRSAVVRIPAYAKAPKNKRFELRNPDATCNPYYAFAAILMAGLDGIQNRIDPHERGWGPYDFNLYTCLLYTSRCV